MHRPKEQHEARLATGRKNKPEEEARAQETHQHEVAEQYGVICLQGRERKEGTRRSSTRNRYISSVEL